MYFSATVCPKAMWHNRYTWWAGALGCGLRISELWATPNLFILVDFYRTRGLLPATDGFHRPLGTTGFSGFPNNLTVSQVPINLSSEPTSGCVRGVW